MVVVLNLHRQQREAHERTGREQRVRLHTSPLIVKRLTLHHHPHEIIWHVAGKPQVKTSKIELNKENKGFVIKHPTEKKERTFKLKEPKKKKVTS